MPSVAHSVDAALVEVGAMNEVLAEPSTLQAGVPGLDARLQRILSLVGEPEIRSACDLVTQASEDVRQDSESILHRERLNGALEALAQELRAVRDRG